MFSTCPEQAPWRRQTVCLSRATHIWNVQHDESGNSHVYYWYYFGSQLKRVSWHASVKSGHISNVRVYSNNS
jgi:hypothetical protein